MLSERSQALLQERRVGVLATIGRDGTPHQSPVWFEYRDGVFLLMTEKNLVKTRNMRRDPRVSLCVQDEQPPYASVTVTGTVKLQEPAPGQHVALATRYLGEAGARVYVKMMAERPVSGGGDVLVTLAVEHVVEQDFAIQAAAAARRAL